MNNNYYNFLVLPENEPLFREYAGWRILFSFLGPDKKSLMKQEVKKAIYIADRYEETSIEIIKLLCSQFPEITCQDISEAVTLYAHQKGLPYLLEASVVPIQ